MIVRSNGGAMTIGTGSRTALLPITVSLGIFLSGGNASAQNSIRLLTATNDGCLTFTFAMESSDPSQLLPLAGWSLGFFSGVAQGSGVDMLRHHGADDLMRRLYTVCRRQPKMALSVAAEEIAKDLVQSR